MLVTFLALTFLTVFYKIFFSRGASVLFVSRAIEETSEKNSLGKIAMQ